MAKKDNEKKNEDVTEEGVVDSDVPVAEESGPAQESALKASLEDDEKRREALEAAGAVIREQGTADLAAPTAGAEAYVKEAEKLAEEDPKFLEDARTDGVDGVRAVSSLNPDPRQVRGYHA